MNEQELKAEYELRKATDPKFKENEELLDACFAERGQVRKPYYEKWKGRNESCFNPPARKRRRVQCIETGEVFSCADEAAVAKNVSRAAIRKAARDGSVMKNGTTWGYLDEKAK